MKKHYTKTIRAIEAQWKRYIMILVLFMGLQGISSAQFCQPTEQCLDAPLFCGHSLVNQVFDNSGNIGIFSPNCGNTFISHSSDWFRIIPCSETLILNIYTFYTTNGDGLQVALYTDCNPGSTVACNPGVAGGAFLPLMLNATVVPGQEYYLQIDGFNYDICNYVIEVVSGINTDPPPPPIDPVAGYISSIPPGNNFCTKGSFRFTADWPDCDNFSAPQLPCYEPEEDSCAGIKWTFPLGTVFIGDQYANPVRVHFNNVAPGNYTISAKPMDCACPDDFCIDCGQLCCPVEELFLPISIAPGSVNTLPAITLCGTDWPPACASVSAGANSALCQVSVNTGTCVQTLQPYNLGPVDTTDLGTVVICPGDSLVVCDTVFTEPGTYTHFCTCDSAVTVTLTTDFSCLSACQEGYNTPAAPGTSPATAPLLCGNYLDGYCSSNEGGGAGNPVYIRFTPCSEQVVLRFSTNDCLSNSGLFIQVGDSLLNTISTLNIANNSTNTLTVAGLEPYAVYYLVFEGLNGNDICGFNIEVVSGIGTADPSPGSYSCNCTPAQILGPSNLCPGDIAVFSIQPGACTLTYAPGSPSGGNGYFCCPDGQDSRDTLNLVWHIPSSMIFLSDSVNVNTITVVVNPNLAGQNLFITDSVWISYDLLPSNPTSPSNPLDSLEYCSCPGMCCLPPGPGPKIFNIQHTVENYNCVLTCNHPVCSIGGQNYTQPGFYFEGDNCFSRYIFINSNFATPGMNLSVPTELTCTSPTTTITAWVNIGGVVTGWTGPGGFSMPGSMAITASQPGTYTCTVTNPNNGCTATMSRVVVANFAPPTAVAGPNTAICTGESIMLSTAGSSLGPQYNYNWNSASTLLTPLSTATYTLTVTNTTNGCTATATTTIAVNPPTIVNHPLQILCNEDWPPSCPNGAVSISGNNATCVETDLITCTEHRFMYQQLPPLTTYLNPSLCPGDTFWLSGNAYTQFNVPYTEVLSSWLGCDSIVNIVLVEQQGCLVECPNANIPAPPGDSCHWSPFLCGNYLNGFCSTSAGLTDDMIDGVLLQNAGFLRFSPCEDSIHLQINVGNCTQPGGGLQFQLMSGDCSNTNLSQPLTILETQTGQFVFNGLDPTLTYSMVFSNANNIAGNICPFNIEVISGIGTATPEPATCSCTGGAITGPDVLCPADIATYELILPNCTVVPGEPSGGNGYFCCPDAENPSDSIVWHLPPGFNFLSDSINVLQISVQADSSFLGVDTTFTGNIFVTITQGGITDTLQFCDCSAVCAISIAPKSVTITHQVFETSCTLTCALSSCTVNNEVYIAAGNYMQSTHCETWLITILEETLPPTAQIQQGPSNCFGAPIELFVVTNPQYLVQWSTGDWGPSIMVTSAGVYEITVTDLSNGCTALASTVVIFPPPVIAGTSPDITICIGETTTLPATGSSIGANYTYQWSNGQSGFEVDVTPIETTVYTVTVTDVQTGCTAIANTTVTVNPLQINLLGTVGYVTCNDPCFSYQGDNYCNPGQYADTVGCEVNQFSIVFQKDTVQVGIAGTINCDTTCLTYLGNTYCQAGNYEVSDSCTVYFFTINTNLAPPTNTSPTHTCLPSNTSYAVGFSIIGTPPYKVNGNLIPGNYYLSEPIGNGETYTFIVEQSSNGCENLVSGSFDCALMCSAEAAEMQLTAIHACIGENIQAQVQTAAQLGPTDSTEFVLHTSSGASIGTIIARNSNGIFGFDAATMTMATAYYISNIAGPANGMGQVDLSHLCTKVSIGQPVYFHPLPVWDSLRIVAPTCSGWNDGSIELVGLMGSEPWEIALNGAPSGSIALFEALSAGTYSLWVEDTYGCTSTASAILEEPETVWLTVSSSQEILPGSTFTLEAQTNVPPPVWTNTETEDQHTGNTWEVQPSGTTTYTCMVTDGNGCTALATVTLRVAAEGLYYPNVINLKDADPVNQWFTLFAVPNYVQEIKEMSIYDRWGSRLFYRQHFEIGIPELGWNGTDRNKQVDPAVFTFTAVLLLRNGTTKMVTGDVTVIR